MKKYLTTFELVKIYALKQNKSLTAFLKDEFNSNSFQAACLRTGSQSVKLTNQIAEYFDIPIGQIKKNRIRSEKFSFILENLSLQDEIKIKLIINKNDRNLSTFLDQINMTNSRFNNLTFENITFDESKKINDYFGEKIINNVVDIVNIENQPEENEFKNKDIVQSIINKVENYLKTDNTSINNTDINDTNFNDTDFNDIITYNIKDVESTIDVLNKLNNKHDDNIDKFILNIINNIKINDENYTSIQFKNILQNNLQDEIYKFKSKNIDILIFSDLDVLIFSNESYSLSDVCYNIYINLDKKYSIYNIYEVFLLI